MTLQTRLMLLTVLVACPPAAMGQTYERLDVSSTGAFGNDGPQWVVMSDDGNIAAFTSVAGNLVLPDDATSVDLYVRDRAHSTTVRIASSIASSSFFPTYFPLEITGDGRWIVYSEWLENHYETYVYDRRLGTTARAAASLFDVLSTGITPDGRYVAILGRNAPYSTPYQAWRFDMQTGALLLASRNPQGAPASAAFHTSPHTISADGDSLVFTSQSADLVSNDTNGALDVFVFTASTSTVERVSIDNAGAGGNFGSTGGSISDDGSRVVFLSTSTNFVPLGSVGLAFPSEIYVHDRVAGTTVLASQTTGGVPLYVDLPARITADGRKVAFESLDGSVIPGDGPAGADIFLHDIGSGVTSGVTLGAPTFAEDFLLDGISGDGRWVTFTSPHPSLPNVSPFGGAYVADVGPDCSAANYCTALPNSTGAAASIGSRGDASLHFGTFTLTAASLPPNAIAILASGTSAVDPGVAFGNGLRCIGGTLIRRGVLHASAGVVSQVQDFSSPNYLGMRPGDVLHYQCVYRDPSAGGAAFNTTDALAVTFCY